MKIGQFDEFSAFLFAESVGFLGRILVKLWHVTFIRMPLAVIFRGALEPHGFSQLWQ